MVIHAKSEGAHHAPPACRKTICETDFPDARKVALAPEAKGEKHTFFDIQRTITVLLLYIALMRFLIKVKHHDLPDVSNACNDAVRPYFPPANTKRPSALH